VTDGVTNTGEVSPAAFHALMQKFDVRVFGFLMGNSGNWPLMRTICEASGGIYRQVSNQDDILGVILLAKSKVTHACLHDADLAIRGVRVFDANDGWQGKVYRGQQLVVFGRYEKAGRADVTLRARLTGADQVYQTAFEFPETDTDNPELERLWAMSRVEEIQAAADIGLTGKDKAADAIRDLGVRYQIVTDHTAMLILTDEAFARHGIGRNNRERMLVEEDARVARDSGGVRDYRVDSQQPMFAHNQPNPRGGGAGGFGGALDPISGTIALGLGILAYARRRRRGEDGEDGEEQQS